MIANDLYFDLLNKEVFHIDVDCAMLHEVIKWQLAKRRSGSHKTKGISDIKATTRKPYRQKGTGRARQGSLCSPQFRGGAVIFGPVVRKHGFALNKKVRKLAKRMVLSQKLKQDELFLIENNVTSSVFNDIVNKKNDIKSKILIVGDNMPYFKKSDNYYINILPPCAINVYNVINHDYVYLTLDSVACLNKELI